MDEIEVRQEVNQLLDLFKLESEAELHQYNGDSEKAVEIMQKIVDNKCAHESEKGWYIQTLARYQYKLSRVESNNLQKSAFKKNYQLLHPKEGLNYKKLAYLNENRINRIKAFVNQHAGYEELILSIDNIIDMLNFGIPAEKFEGALQELGVALGFLSQRPDKEYKKGPDNLWCGVNDKYLLFECKSEVLESRNEINKHEASQMNSHCGWFEQTYGEKQVKRILIIPTKNLTYHSNFTHSVQIMRKNRLKKLRDNVKGFFKEFKNYSINELSDEKIHEFLSYHELNIEDLIDKYSEDYYHNKK